MIELLEDKALQTNTMSKEVSNAEIIPLKKYDSKKGNYLTEDKVLYSCDAVCKNCHCATYV